MKRPYLREVRRAIKASAHRVSARQVGDAWRASALRYLKPYILDSEFVCVDLATWSLILAWSRVDDYDYEAQTRDCDNFAAALHGTIPLRFAVNSVAYVLDISGGHAYNALVYHQGREGIDIAIVEPQTDGFVRIGEQRSGHEMYKASDGFAILG